VRIALIGLGNPGKEYHKTRHNLGHLFVEYFSQNFGVELKPGKGEFLFGQRESFLVFKTTTFMNLSGIAVSQIVEIFSLKPQEIFICHDDLDMSPYTVKVKFDGGSGGHRGIESCVYHLRTEDFYRLKFGIGKPDYMNPREYVLSVMSDDELNRFEKSFKIAYEGLKIMVEESLNKGITYINTHGKNLL